ncbi:MAG: hypothetical protein ACYCPQ_03590 [Elusimicrobiota bacterium]
METYDFEKLAREITIGKAKQAQDSAALAAFVARDVLVAGIEGTRFKQDPRATVLAVCRGVMGGLLICDQKLPQGAVAILEQMTRVAEQVKLDPMDMMTWAMEGIAAVAVLGGHDARSAIADSIAENFMGAGDVFRNLCDDALAKKASST